MLIIRVRIPLRLSTVINYRMRYIAGHEHGVNVALSYYLKLIPKQVTSFLTTISSTEQSKQLIFFTVDTIVP